MIRVFSFAQCFFALTLLVMTCVSLPDAAGAEQKTDPFIRVFRNTAGPQALQTAIAHYVPDAKSKFQNAKVDLVVAVHIGEAEYFEELNDRFQGYDAVLYELVAPKDEDVPTALAEKGSNPLSAIQRTLTETLRLEFQLDAVDYSKSNFVHADLSPDEFVASMKRRGESATSMLVKFLAASLEQQKHASPFDSLDALRVLLETDPKMKSLRLKRMLAQQTEDMESLVNAINGQEGSTLISERNARAVQVLEEQLKLGKKKIAIYYGAAHMGDIANRMAKSPGFSYRSSDWLDAWNLREPSGN